MNNSQSKEIKIKIKGLGGQGVKFLSGILGNMLQDNDKYVSIHLDYDAAMRGGGIESTMIVSDEQIGCPLTKDVNFLVDMAQNDQEPTKSNGFKADQVIPADNNMTALGKLLKALGFDLDQLDLDQYLPARAKEQNIKYINQGYRS
ncbi:MAG: hypothetical protein GF381_03370 [Candidatus Pacebacteria bacterium]|nr:hypothetical protein [Candidatus Paceibacterota bacterium]